MPSRLPFPVRRGLVALLAAVTTVTVAATAGPAAAAAPGSPAAAQRATTHGPQITLSHIDGISLPTGYTGVSPVRRADTRHGLGVPQGQVPSGGTLTVGVTGQGVPADALAVLVNVTAVSPPGYGYVSAWPAGAPRPTASTLNLAPGRTVANAAIVSVGDGGAITLFAAGTATDLVVDVAGYLAAGSGDGLVPTAPVRMLDTRHGTGTAARPLAAGETRRVAAPDWVPADATGLVLNLTATGATSTTHLTAWPGGTRPATSNLNLGRGATVPNLVVVGLSGGGFSLFNAAGTTQVIGDVQGYLEPGAQGTFVGQTPQRTVDTRSGLGAARTRLGPGQSVTLTVAGADAGAVALNVTAVNATASTHLTVWPAGTVRPYASHVNLVPGTVVPNAVVVKTTGGRVQLFNAAGSVDVVVDTLATWQDVGTAPSAPPVVPDADPVPPAPPVPAVPAPPAPSGRGSASAYALNRYSDGTVLRWNPCAPITYRVNLDQAPPGALADVQTALRAVSAAGGLQFSYLGATSRVPQRSWFSSWPAGEAQLVIGWASSSGAGSSDFLPGGQVVGQGGWSARGGNGKALQIVNGVVVLDRASTLLTSGFGSQGRGQLLLHELGHAVGLSHVSEQAQLMYPSITFSVGAFGAGDVAGLRAVGRPAGCL